MKLLFCRLCGDVRKITREGVECRCASVWGRYLDDDWHADVSENAIVLGLNNHHLSKAVRDGAGDVGCWVYQDGGRVRWVQEEALRD